MRTWRLSYGATLALKGRIPNNVQEEARRQAAECGEDVHVCDDEGNILWTAQGPAPITDWNTACRWTTRGPS